MPVQSVFASYEISLASPSGVPVMTLDRFQSLTVTRTVDAVGALAISLPYSDALWNAARKDSIIDVRRQGTRGGMRRVMGGLWLVMNRQQALGVDGSLTITLNCADQLDILRRYIVAFQPGTAQAAKTGAAETLIKGVATDNLLDVDPTLSRTGLGSSITIEPDGGRGYNPVAISCSWQTVLAVCTQVARASTQYITYGGLPSYLCFDLEVQSVNPPTFIFRCYSGQRGIDRSAGSSFALVMSDSNGAFGAATYAEDFSSAASFILCGGQSTAGVAATATAGDATLETAGPFAHTEVYASQQMTSDTDTLQTQANNALRLNRPVVGFQGVTINQSPAMQLGVDFDWGDRFTAKLGREVVTCRLESMTLTYQASSSEGQPAETLTGTLRSEYSP